MAGRAWPGLDVENTNGPGLAGRGPGRAVKGEKINGPGLTEHGPGCRIYNSAMTREENMSKDQVLKPAYIS